MRKYYVALAIAIFAFLSALFQFRGPIRDAYGRWQRGPVPPAVSRAQIEAQNGTATNAPETDQEPDDQKDPIPKPTKPTNSPTKTPEPVESSDASKPTTDRPETLNLSVLFVPQAPKKNWDELHEDTCEEASMLMLKAYRDDLSEMSVDRMETRLTDITTYETTTYGEGGWKSTDAARTAAIMRDFLGMTKVRVVKITSLDDVKNEIAKGHPVMLPASGKLLKNPNFKNGGPLYHMLVAKGYTGTTVVTNDPGTRLGADYVYQDDVLWEAIHDWNGGDVLNGDKVMIVGE